MRTPCSFYAALAFLMTFTAPAQSPQKPDDATAAWWAQTVALSNDSMEGRDTGSEAYERAAQYVADQFKAAGLKPAGDNGTFFQRVPMHQIALAEDKSSIEIINAAGKATSLHFSTDVTTVPRETPLSSEAPMIFLGYGLPPADIDLKGKIAVFFNNSPADLAPADRETYTGRRLRALTQAGVAAIISIDNPVSIEPFHWPSAYARSVTLAGTATSNQRAPVLIRINPASLEALFAASGHNSAEIVTDGGRGAPLTTFPLNLSARINVTSTSKDISSTNVLAILPGSDPKLAPEYVALSAHLDGYGYGTPVLGDKLYNGTLDDAAYVALLIELAHDLVRTRRQQELKNELHGGSHPPCMSDPPKESAQPCFPPFVPSPLQPARSLLFCIFTGEEKGLLGSAYFTQHLTVPKENIVANLNLDQLRPIFPLKILTMEGLTDSTLGDTVRTVAAQFSIEIRPDLEPERNLFRRADNYNFVRIGIPIAGFVFGYDKGSPEEVIYRDWYARRYHKPQDDIKTPIDWAAAGKFNRFYTALALTIANTPDRPQWLPSSPYSPNQRTAQ
jgi:Zn-dependent M28 family amino/carboxypeptidase